MTSTTNPLLRLVEPKAQENVRDGVGASLDIEVAV
jgi:hypothetical protein